MSKLLGLVSAVAMIAAGSSVYAADCAANSNSMTTTTTTTSNTKAPKEDKNACYKINNSWDVNGNVSYLYWYMAQDAMDVATSATGLVAGPVSYQKFGYNSAFQIGLGMEGGMDVGKTGTEGWALNAEYTWYHAKEKQALVAAAGSTLADTWSKRGATTDVAALNTEWKLHLDQIDLLAGKPLCKGRSVTVFPSAGLRALFIRQNESITNPAVATSQSGAMSHSWAIGAATQINSRMMIWKGLRFDAEMGGSLLYMKYTTVKAYTSTTTASVDKNRSALRPTLDMGLGLGYGAFFSDNKFYLDLSARYDFNLFWEQNVMHNYATIVAGTAGTALGDLFLHGLTVNLRLDF